jgi:hypothetical protein
MRRPVVIDTNVLLAANGDSSCSISCALECLKALRAIQKSGCVVVDNGYEILSEYRKQWNPRRQPGAGFLFWKWLLNNQGRLDHCHGVAITKLDIEGYAEFPDHEGLRDFDPSDQKFVAVSVVHAARPHILQATDSKWWGWNTALKECGITVKFVCPVEIEAKFQQKMGNG